MKILNLLFLAVCWPFATSAFAGDFQVTTAFQTTVGPYKDSAQRDKISSMGVFISADYLERWGITIGASHTDVLFKPGFPDTAQDAIFASGRWSLTPDGLGGFLAARIDGHAIDNDDPSRNTDDLRAFAPQISYLTYEKDFYLDLGYAHSTYFNDFKVTQLTPTVGFAMNQGATWIRLRGYFITPSQPARAQGKEKTSAVEFKIMRWLAPRRPFGIETVQLALLSGERILAVDSDAGAVYNVADLQEGSLSFGLEWLLLWNAKLLLNGSFEKYTNIGIGNAYQGQSVSVSLLKEW